MLCLLKLCFWRRAKTLLLRGIRKCSAARWPTGSIRALLSATRHSRMLQHHQPNSSSFGSFQDLLYRRLLHLLRRHIHLPPLQCHNTDRQLVQTTHLLLQYLRCVLDRGHSICWNLYSSALRQPQPKVGLHLRRSFRPDTQEDETTSKCFKRDHVMILRADSAAFLNMFGICSEYPLFTQLRRLNSARQ